VTKKLLAHYGIRKPVYRYIRNALPQNLESVALLTDAGTPAISDPGLELVKFALGKGFQIIPIPGPSALSAIISVSDIDLDKFVFLGFPPRKKGRQKFFQQINGYKAPIILFEAPHRIQKTLSELEKYCGNQYVNIGRELTKIYEEIFRGKLSEAQKYFIGEKIRGEFVIIADTK